MKKVALVIDKTDSYRDFQKNRLIKKWNVESLTNISSLDEANTTSLFGDITASFLFLAAADTVKTTVSILEKFSDDDKKFFEDNGLIISTNISRVSTKKIENIFKENSWEVILATKEDDPLPIKLFKNLNLKHQVIEEAIAYVGDKNELLFPIVEGLIDLPKNLQQKITFEDILTRIPQAPGSVPPWEIEQDLMNKDLNKAIEKSRRINSNSNYLLWLITLKNKMLLYYDVSNIIKDNPNISDAEIMKILKINNPKGFYFVRKNATKYSPETFSQILNLIVRTEYETKGWSKVNPHSLCEILLVRIFSILVKEGK